MSAKSQAIQDIKNDLKATNKCFIAFHKELNPVMDKIVKQYLEFQK